MNNFILNYLLLCDYSIEDKHGKITLAGIFDNYSSTSFPITIPSFTIAGNANVKNKDIKKILIEIEILDSNKIILFPTKPRIELNNLKELQSFNFLFKMNNLPLEKAGEYIFNVYANEELLGESRLIAIKINPDGN